MPRKIAAFCIQAGFFHLACLQQGRITHLVSENLSDTDEKSMEQQLIIFKKRYQLGKYALRYVLGSDQVLIRSIDLPVELKTAEILDWLKWQVAKALNVRAKDLVMDYRIIKNPDGNKLQYVLAKRKLIDQIFQRCINAGLNLKAIYIDIFALQQLVALHFYHRVQAPYLCIVSTVRTFLVLMSHEKIIFSQAYSHENAMEKVRQIVPGAKQVLVNQNIELDNFQLTPFNLSEALNKKYSVAINAHEQMFLIASLANELLEKPNLFRQGKSLVCRAWKRIKRS